MAADDASPVAPPRAAFDVAAYAAQSQQHGKGLAAVHGELSGRLRDVRRELHSLINHRYEDFLGLSTSLTEVGSTIGSVKAPLADIRGKVESAHNDLASKLDYVDSRLRYRAAIREKRQLLRLFIDLSQLLDRADAVLKEAADMGAVVTGREYVKCLERAAADVSQIRYFARKGAGHPFVQQAAERVGKIESTLLAALDQSLARCISVYLDARQQGADEAGGGDAAAMIAQCLRAYSTVEEGERAEDIMRSRLVRPFVAEALGDQGGGKGMGMDPHVFAPMLQKILGFVGRVGVPLADSVETHFPASGYALESRVFWREIATTMMGALPLLFVPGMPDRFHHNYLATCRFMSAFGAMFASIGEDNALDELLAAEPSYAEFNRKWQLSAYFTIRKKHVVDVLAGRGAGRRGADDVQSGMARSPGLGAARSRSGAPSPAAGLVAHGAQASGSEHDAVVQARLGAGLHTEAAAKAIWAISRCWASDVYLEPLAARFWQLTIQVVLWYRQTTGQTLGQLVKTNSALAGAAALESPEIDELLQHVHDSWVSRALVADQIRTASCHLPVPPQMPPALGADGESADAVAAASADFRGAMLHSMEAAMDQAWAPLADAANGAVDYLATTIVTASCSSLASQLRRTTSQFRHTNREPPTTPSPFVAKLFALLAAAETRVGDMQCSDDARDFVRATRLRLRASVCADVSREMARACSEALSTISKTEASLLRLRRTRTGGTGGGSDAAARGVPDDLPVPAGVDLRGAAPTADNDKIRRQVWLDVAETARIIAEHGAQPHHEFAAFEQLIAPLGT